MRGSSPRAPTYRAIGNMTRLLFRIELHFHRMVHRLKPTRLCLITQNALHARLNAVLCSAAERSLFGSATTFPQWRPCLRVAALPIELTVQDGSSGVDPLDRRFGPSKIRSIKRHDCTEFTDEEPETSHAVRCPTRKSIRFNGPKRLAF